MTPKKTTKEKPLKPPPQATVADVETLKARVEEAEGCLDIIHRENAGEPDDSIASDYGGTGWEKQLSVMSTRAVRKQLKDLRVKFESEAVAFDGARLEILELKRRLEESLVPNDDPKISRIRELERWITEASKTGQVNFASAVEVLKK